MHGQQRSSLGEPLSLDPDQFVGGPEGILQINTRWSGCWEGAFDNLAPVFRYLDGLRREAGLPAVEE